MEQQFIVIKKNIRGEETWRYHGELLERHSDRIILQAFFDREDMQVHGLFLGKGDRFVETWFTERWYNIFEVHAREDDHIRGWYCNIGMPAHLEGDTISYIDLSLDLLVFPDGRQLILDEDEFGELEISEDIQRRALQALDELQSQFLTGNPTISLPVS